MASIVRFTASWVSNLAAKLVYSTVEGYAFLFSRYGASVLLGAEAALLLRAAGPHRAAGTAIQAATATVIARGVWAFFHSAQQSHRNAAEERNNNQAAAAATAIAAATQSIWDWEPPSGDAFASGAWHVLRELVVTATKMQKLYPEISTLMALPELARPEELTSRLYYFYVASENAGVSDYDLSDSKLVPEAMLDSLRAKRPFATYAYDCTSDTVLADTLRPLGYRLLAAKYEPDITSGCPAYYLAMSNTSATKTTITTADGNSTSTHHATSTGEEQREEVILCIRGTYSPEDVFTDLLMVGVAFGGDEEERKLHPSAPVYNVHAGMAKAAFFLAEKFGSMLCMLRDAGVKVTLIGHSLGAGVASILALHLKQKKYGFTAETLQCFAFEPPACLDLPLAEACSDVVLSMVHADDIVPRMAVEPFSAFLKELAEFDWQAESKKEGAALPAPLAVMHKLAGIVGSKAVAEGAAEADVEKVAKEEEEETTSTTTTAAVGEKTKAVTVLHGKYNPFVPGKVVFVCESPSGNHSEIQGVDGGDCTTNASNAVAVLASTAAISCANPPVLLEPSSPVLRRIRLTSTIVSDHFIDKPACMMALGEKTT